MILDNLKCFCGTELLYGNTNAITKAHHYVSRCAHKSSIWTINHEIVSFYSKLSKFVIRADKTLEIVKYIYTAIDHRNGENVLTLDVYINPEIIDNLVRMDLAYDKIMAMKAFI